MVQVASTKRVIGPTRLSVSGYYCFRDQGMIPYESTLERDFLRKMAVSRRVLTVEAQPLSLHWEDASGRVRRYTPDYLVHWRWMGEFYRTRELPWLVEVKPREDLRKHWSEWHAKFLMASRYAAQQGWRFRLLDEGRIRDAMFRNAVVLERYRRFNHAFSLEQLPSALMCGICRAHRIVDHLTGPMNLRFAYVWHLLAVGYLDCDLTQPLGSDTEVWRSHEF